MTDQADFVTGIQVELTKAEFHAAAACGLRRFRESDLAGLNHSVSYRGNYLERLEREVGGACGEMALCRAFGLDWEARVGNYHTGGDVGADIEGRWTKHDGGHLIVREKDRPVLDRWFYLVTGTPPVLVIRGSQRGHVVVADGHHQPGRDGRQAHWWMAQRHLLPCRGRSAAS